MLRIKKLDLELDMSEEHPLLDDGDKVELFFDQGFCVTRECLGSGLASLGGSLSKGVVLHCGPALKNNRMPIVGVRITVDVDGGHADAQWISGH